MKKLSNYTIASYCSDLSDVNAGINEIITEYKKYQDLDKKTPSYFSIRLKKLKEKQQRLERKERKEVRISFTFVIDECTLTEAIKSLLYQKVEINEKSILNIIKNESKQKGISVIKFPELWGNEQSNDDDELQRYILKYKKSFGL